MMEQKIGIVIKSHCGEKTEGYLATSIVDAKLLRDGNLHFTQITEKNYFTVNWHTRTFEVEPGTSIEIASEIGVELKKIYWTGPIYLKYEDNLYRFDDAQGKHEVK